ncbi:sporulation protein YabP [Haloimpatiens sp. FM7330]|uniref:sporulation protein YabP n=1 Tax=Haloimpatiens sp. FM7330 TaxID=3298610 RepID=UPI00362B01F5
MEIKKEIKIEDRKSSLILENRKKIHVSGVSEVISFNDEEINLNTVLGGLKIIGSQLKMNKLDVQNGDLIIIGTINSCAYSNDRNKKDSESLFSKLFK